MKAGERFPDHDQPPVADAEFAAVFFYTVGPAEAARFEAVYGPDGEWTRFFALSPAFLRTELWRTAETRPHRYLVVDRWRSEAGYDDFLAAHRAEYERRSRIGAGLYRRGQALGRFTRA